MQRQRTPNCLAIPLVWIAGGRVNSDESIVTGEPSRGVARLTLSVVLMFNIDSHDWELIETGRQSNNALAGLVDCLRTFLEPCPPTPAA